MSYNNYLDDVYTVGENNYDNQDDSSGNDSDRDQRRGRQDCYDTISDRSSLMNAIDPISDQEQFRYSSVLMQTLAAPFSLIADYLQPPERFPMMLKLRS